LDLQDRLSAQSLIEAECQARGLELLVLPQKAARSQRRRSNAPDRLGDMSSMQPTICRIESRN
jgi:hypothetical protein